MLQRPREVCRLHRFAEPSPNPEPAGHLQALDRTSGPHPAHQSQRCCPRSTTQLEGRWKRFCGYRPVLGLRVGLILTGKPRCVLSRLPRQHGETRQPVGSSEQGSVQTSSPSGQASGMAAKARPHLRAPWVNPAAKGEISGTSYALQGSHGAIPASHTAEGCGARGPPQPRRQEAPWHLLQAAGGSLR